MKKVYAYQEKGEFVKLYNLKDIIPEKINFHPFHKCKSLFDIFLPLDSIRKLPTENINSKQLEEQEENENMKDQEADEQELHLENQITDVESYSTLDDDGFQIPKQNIKNRRHKFKKNFQEAVPMDKKEADSVKCPWKLSNCDRWRIYKYWINELMKREEGSVKENVDIYESCCNSLEAISKHQETKVMKRADIIAMTTTCAAKYRTVLDNIKPKVVIIEEAAEVLEAHVITSLNSETEHVILIGDHKQLKPNPSVFKLAKEYQLEVSLFERMVNNGLECQTLDIQHRMRPEISKLIRNMYPTLKDSAIVKNFPKIKGVHKNVTFITHKELEEENEYLNSKSNIHEAKFMVAFCKYLLQQGYKPSQITMLTGYTGQLIALKNVMPRDEFDGVRIKAIDNFQGEESDIILLSLVRSNLDGNVGFLNAENRVCVALSRAKHGLYVIGNFSLLEEKSLLWNKILSDVRDMDCLQEHITLRCQNHPETKISLLSSDLFIAEY